MKERGICFDTEMVKAILAGTKTQTRRVIRSLPPDTTWAQQFEYEGPGGPSMAAWIAACPYGPVGRRLYVREAWNGTQGEGLAYKATDPDMDGELWRSGRFMPRWASRITLEVTDVRVQQVTAISPEDALAEGTEGQHSFAVLWDRLNGVRGYPWASAPWVWAISFKRVTP